MATDSPKTPRDLPAADGAARLQERVENARQRFYQAEGHPPDIPSLKALAGKRIQSGKNADAEAVLSRLEALQPQEVQWQTDLAAVCHRQGNYRKAEKHLRRAASLRPDSAPIWSNLGYTLYLLGQYAEAERSCRTAVALAPDFPEAACNLGIALMAGNRRQEAFDLFKVLVDRHPDHARGWSNLAILLLQRGRLTEAVAACSKALQLNPDFVEAHCNMGLALQERMQAREALMAYERALAMAPGHPAARSNRLMCMQYIDGLGSERIRAAAAESWSSNVPVGKAIQSRPARSRKLRIGYLSGDFGRHPVGWFILPVLRSHTRERYRFFCYAAGSATDEITTEIQTACDRWRPVHGATDDEMAQIIGADGIDVLVDLAGHTAGNRLGVFQRRPAPVQVSWLGYFASTGLESMDFIFLSRDQAPPGSRSFFRERLFLLDQCQFCYQPPQYSPPVGPAPNRTRGHITFGCFNNTAKLNPQVLSVWGRILSEVAESRLLLKWRSLADAGLRQRIRRRFAMMGVDADRIEFRGASPHPDMLGEYGDVDIALDTFPFNGGLTTCESLWMGVPVVTLAQLRPVSRQSMSILKQAGLPDLVATTPDGYLAIAKRLAASPSRLDALRDDLRPRLQTGRPGHAKALAAELERGFSQVLQIS